MEQSERTANVYSNVTNSMRQRDLQSTASSNVLTGRVQRMSTAMRPTAFAYATSRVQSPPLYRAPEYSKRVQQRDQQHSPTRSPVYSVLQRTNYQSTANE